MSESYCIYHIAHKQTIEISGKTKLMILEKRRIVITGGTSGIGYELAKHLHPLNEVIVIARSTDKLKRLAQELSGITTYQADLSNPRDVEAVADTIIKRFKSIDVLINNAAIQYTPTFLDDDFSYESISREITLNFTSVCSLSYLFLPALLHSTTAVILNINSGLGLTPKKSSAVYCGTKGAMDIFSQSLRYQLKKTNVRVQQAFLALVDTPMTYGRGEDKMSAEIAATKIIHGIEHNINDHDIGKVKLLRFLLRFMPTVARSIMIKY